jgi:hypothetical protein
MDQTTFFLLFRAGIDRPESLAVQQNPASPAFDAVGL